MTPDDLKQARRDLGLSVSQTARLLGYDGDHADRQYRALESGRKPIRGAQARLMTAYRDGYRPNDWSPDKEQN